MVQAVAFQASLTRLGFAQLAITTNQPNLSQSLQKHPYTKWH